MVLDCDQRRRISEYYGALPDILSGFAGAGDDLCSRSDVHRIGADRQFLLPVEDSVCTIKGLYRGDHFNDGNNND